MNSDMIKKTNILQLIVRHPLDALYSEFNRMYGGNKTGYADIKHLVNSDGSLTWSKYIGCTLRI